MKLIDPKTDGKISLEKVLNIRRTIRSFKPDPISVHQLSQLLWAAQGITDGYLRTAASAGALYPMDVYAATGSNSVPSLEAGLYIYKSGNHSISFVNEGDRRRQLAEASLSQMWMVKAPVHFIITAEYKRITEKYRERGIRYAMIEAGHIAQNIFLQSEALGLGAGIVGAFSDEEVNRAAGIPTKHEPLLIMPVGYKD
jgi:SagB-type dehydrogenase family enzyme